MEKSSSQPRRVGLICLVLYVGAVTAIVALLLLHHLNLPAALSLIIGVTSIPTSYLTWVTFRRSEARGEELADVADELARKVRRQWEVEQIVRGVDNPRLPVSWEAANPDLIEEWSSLVSTAKDWPAASVLNSTTWAVDPAGLAGSGNELGAVLRRVPTGRLVVLGEPGAGKTMLLVRLVLDLLTNRDPGDRVPVLLSLASWNPADEDGLYGWLAGRLAIEYPVLAEPFLPALDSESRAEALLAERLILPVLDGLDEIPEAVRDRALDQINAVLLAGQNLVLSSRTDDYRKAVHPPGRRSVRLNGAAGVALRELDATEVKRYLCHPEIPNSTAAARWDEVLDTLGTDTPTGWALRTPLMVSLARAVYSPPGVESTADPAELCKANRFGTEEDVKRHLFGAFVDAAYRHDCRWTIDQAKRYLVFLAQQFETTDLAWWELHRAVASSRWLVGLVVGLLAGVVGGVFGGLGAAGHTGGFVVALAAAQAVALTARFVRGSANQHAAGLVAGVAGGLAGGVVIGGFFGGLAGGVTDGLAAGFWVGPVGGLLGGLLGGLAGGVVSGLVGSLQSGVTGAVADGIALGVAAGLWAGLEGRRTPAHSLRWSKRVGICLGLIVGFGALLLAGLAGGLLAGIVAMVGGGAVIMIIGGFMAGTPADPRTEADPNSVLFHDRRTFLKVALTTGLMVGLFAGLVTWHAGGITHGLEAGLAAGVAVGLAAGSIRAAWGTYTIARCWLALRGRIPLSLTAFLTDAHQKRGVLRQVGAVYQFRHKELQQYLATRSEPSRLRGRALPRPPQPEATCTPVLPTA
jgi:hypothetical protein